MWYEIKNYLYKFEIIYFDLKLFNYIIIESKMLMYFLII